MQSSKILEFSEFCQHGFNMRAMQNRFIKCRTMQVGNCYAGMKGLLCLLGLLNTADGEMTFISYKQVM